MNTGISGSVTAMITAEIQSRSATTATHRHRNDHGQQQLGEVEREVRIERVDAPGGQDSQLAGAPFTQVARPQGPDMREQGRAQLRLGACR